MKTCDHVPTHDIKKASEKLFCHAGGPEKEMNLVFVALEAKEEHAASRIRKKDLETNQVSSESLEQAEKWKAGNRVS